MRIHQINCTYSAEEDRLVIKINTTEKEEHELIFTRRYLKLLLTIFNDYFSNDSPSLAKTSDPITKKTVTEFQREQAISKTDLSKPYETPKASHSSGILYKLKSKITDTKELKVGFYDKNNKGLELLMPNQMVHQFYYLLEKTLSKADWNLNMFFKPDIQAAKSSKPTLH